jgi:hypothetical protein
LTEAVRIALGTPIYATCCCRPTSQADFDAAGRSVSGAELKAVAEELLKRDAKTMRWDFAESLRDRSVRRARADRGAGRAW